MDLGPVEEFAGTRPFCPQGGELTSGLVELEKGTDDIEGIVKG